MSTSAPAENPLPETNIVVLGGLLADDTVMDWLKPQGSQEPAVFTQTPKAPPLEFLHLDTQRGRS